MKNSVSIKGFTRDTKIEITFERVDGKERVLNTTIGKILEDEEGWQTESEKTWEKMKRAWCENGAMWGSPFEEITYKELVQILKYKVEKSEHEKELAIVKLEEKGRVEEMAKEKKTEVREQEQEPSITAILRGYSEVTVRQNGLMISFKSKEDILDAFKALTTALDKADKKAMEEEMGFSEETK